LRPRVLIYAGIISTIILLAVISLTIRSPLKFNVIRDRNLPRITENGSVENVYRLQIMNTAEQPRHYRVEVGGLPGATVISETAFDVQATASKVIPTRVSVPANSAKIGSNRITFTVRERDNEKVSVTEKAVFLMPR